MTNRPTMLILSFSPIVGDARVLKQVARFTGEYDVTTLGYGEAPQGVVEHISMPREIRFDDRDGKLVLLKRYRRVYWKLSAVKWSRAALKGRRFDVIIANDVEAVPVAVALKPRYGVLADLHEYSPRLHDDNPSWFEKITPWFEWVVRRYVTRADAWTTVSEGLAAEYERNFGFHAELVSNATPYQELEPSPVSSPIRLVHSGAGLVNRQLHLMAEAVASADADVTLDFYLTPNHPAYMDELKAFAATTDRVRVLDPVPYSELVATLNQYDVGVFMLPPRTFNYRHALPNKLFDFVQARLGIVVGPSPEMAAYVTDHHLGVVSDEFTVDSLRAAIETLTVEKVSEYKRNAHASAAELAGEHQVEKWASIVAGLMEKKRR
ncbi:glycosyltransferase [Microbacterium aerolatum]|uniref:glycosyltransferase n=1 Tax=Microbacterium aerolatum TaxID=153731 RepID=UPI0020015CFC|nr:glycosyltransferase [Microbacterium aerolatum]MCK3770205.1 glycosyltransferase [Microbacterium aerolatum]